MTERFSLSAESIQALINFLKNQPYQLVRGLFDILDRDLKQYTVDHEIEDEKPVTNIRKRKK